MFWYSYCKYDCRYNILYLTWLTTANNLAMYNFKAGHYLAFSIYTKLKLFLFPFTSYSQSHFHCYCQGWSKVKDDPYYIIAISSVTIVNMPFLFLWSCTFAKNHEGTVAHSTPLWMRPLKEKRHRCLSYKCLSLLPLYVLGTKDIKKFIICI